ncbi:MULTISPECIES: ABC transporter permease [Micrococcaceae]|uniref:ABC transporter permease n=1 Tax=Micrococcaceae TaxID=1268 RepID=UPI000CFB78DA|nr:MULTISPECIES: ABC transporter permease [unclassified Arthrobacter]PQZ89672.1 ABC transporter permease [Arthrobacter sp. MYb222]PRB75283.1 ABC transporter permease [Arthrobacter sp. MYb214]
MTNATLNAPAVPSRASKAKAPSSSAAAGRKILVSSWLIVAVVAAWWFGSANSTNFFIPSLESILEALVRDLGNGVIISGAWYSLSNLFVGLALAAFFGICGGLLLGEVPLLLKIVDPIIHFFRAVPQAALVPMIIGVFGMGQGPKMGTIAFACMWPILLNTIDGILGIEPTVRKFSKVYRIPRGLHFRRVILPGATPQIVAGIRVALPIGITVMVVSEMFASIEGLGFYILNSSATFKVPETWAGALLVGVIGYIISILFVLVEKRILRWYHASGAQ